MRGAVTCDLLDAIELFIRRFVVIEEAQSTAVALWVAHTWTVEAAYSMPYLFVTSAEPESGKTRLLELFKELARDPLSTMNISDAALFRVIEAKQPSLLFDEVDAIFNDKARERGVREDLRALLNAGYRRGERVYRMGGGNHTTLESFAVFCPKALAGLGNLPQTLRSRCIRSEAQASTSPTSRSRTSSPRTSRQSQTNSVGGWRRGPIWPSRHFAAHGRSASTGCATVRTRCGDHCSRSPSWRGPSGRHVRDERNSRSRPTALTTARRSGCFCSTTSALCSTTSRWSGPQPLTC